jgi:prepilin-type N-terminal cleavage/methylation domain-containing protein
MIYPSKKIKFQKGFSLVEMAIVLAIIGALLAGILPAISGQIEQAKRNETRKQLAEIQQAIIGYAIINGHLPYPAKPTIATNTSNAGTSDSTLTYGVVPWATLGTSETDAWGRRFTYAAANLFTSNFLLSTTGNLKIKSAATGGVDIATNIPAVIVSHGPNGYGAYTQQGTPVSTSADADEADNSNTGVNFVSHDLSSTFDDLVVWISPNILFNRMVEAGKLP